MTHSLILVIALMLDAALGEPRWLWSRAPHPAVLMGRAVAALDRHLNRGKYLRVMGVLTAGVLMGAALAVGWTLSLAGPLVETVIAAMLLAQRSLVQHVQDVSAGLRLSTGDGRVMVTRIVSRDCQHMDASQVARAAIESAAENLSDGVVAPAFWFLVGGLPGMLIYKAINTADSMIGYRTPRHERFGWAAARLDDLLNLIPARLTGLILAALSGQMREWPAIVKDARAHRSPNAGWPEAAIARALDVALAGPRGYHGTMLALPWVNHRGRHDIGPDEIDAAVVMLWRLWAVLLFLTLGVAGLSLFRV
ncbi:adenosylcobinamide-phosphate synthase CbiB [Pontibaca salina]|uniref:Cobalamin biosynthesis protein CobD n=1 Tax=Pontibaca salina TaxID=2795731 RepID=A0A934M0N7_9RHOB|nr:adenosylcobinamide-phosphate synthase CbiB [Pontibaca salina]MBI6628841.1 cobalamin biosynthesis protein [Pontibaca salina]